MNNLIGLEPGIKPGIAVLEDGDLMLLSEAIINVPAPVVRCITWKNLYERYDNCPRVEDFLWGATVFMVCPWNKQTTIKHAFDTGIIYYWLLVHGVKEVNFVDTQKLHKVIQSKQQDLWHIFEYDMKKLEIWSEIWEIFMDNDGRYRENMAHIRDAYLLIRYGQEYMNKEV